MKVSQERWREDKVPHQDRYVDFHEDPGKYSFGSKRTRGFEFVKCWKVILRSLIPKQRRRMKQHCFQFNLLRRLLLRVPRVFELTSNLNLVDFRKEFERQGLSGDTERANRRPSEGSMEATFLSAYRCPQKRKLFGGESVISVGVC